MTPNLWRVVGDPTCEVGQLEFDSGPVPADGTVHQIPAYTFPVPVTIVDVRIWQGADAAAPDMPFAKVDLFAVLYASWPHGYKLLQAPDDRYREGNSPIHWRTAPPRRLRAGDSIGGGFFGLALFGVASHTHLGVIVEYVKNA